MTEKLTYFDRPLRFFIADRDVRGRAVRLGPALDAILSAHQYPPAIEKLLAEALVLAALLGSLLKDAGGQLTMQAQTEQGAVKLLVVDFRNTESGVGELRGYVEYDMDRLVEQGEVPTLYGLFGKGYLAITYDQPAAPGESGRYQGIVPLEGDSLADAAQHYFEQSEQLPTYIKTAFSSDENGKCVAAGLLVQHMPDGEEGRDRLHTRLDHPEWEHVHILAQTMSEDELLDPSLGMEDIVWRLFHEEKEVRIEQGVSLARGCRCDEAHIRGVLARFPKNDRADMADESGMVNVDCNFCSRIFPISLTSLDN